MAIGGDFTRRLLTDAGLAAGMRVLDLGCGTGEVSLIAAELVEPGGEVVGVDRDAGALDTARARAAEAGHAQVSILAGDIEALPDLDLFDAIVARRVLMYLANPVAVLERLVPALHPAGLIAVHEHDMTMVPASVGEMPLHERVQSWVRQMLLAEEADTHMGFHLHATLSQAGFSVETVRAEAVVQTPSQRYELAEIVAAIWPRILAHGIVDEAEADVETLAERLEAERIATGATYVGDMMFGAWGRKLS